MADVYIATDWRGRSEPCPIAIVQVDYVAKTRGVEGLDEARFSALDLQPRFGVVGLERRIDETYQEVLSYIDSILIQNESLLKRSVEVLVGINDVGRSIDYLIEGLEMSPTLISISTDAGVSIYSNNIFTVPRTELIAAMASAYARDMVRVAEALKLAPVLNDQLVDVQVRSDTGQRIKRNGQENTDDLARALAMCLWMARQEHTRDLTYLDRLADEFSDQVEGWDVYRYARNREGQYG